jgi:thiol-disulfide isomerase/thioredoxin
MHRYLVTLVLLVQAAAAIVPEVRAALKRNDLAGAERIVEDHRQRHGVSPEWIEAQSWLGRGALAARQFDRAQAYAEETRRLVLARTPHPDADRRLSIALGASIEVRAHAMAGRGGRDQAVRFLRSELKRWHRTSIRTRIQKNINLLNLEGKPALPIDTSLWLGPKPASLKGRPVLLFLWAHWCGDCKGQAPVLARIAREYGIALVGVTQRYGYVAGGEEATPEQELKYIDEVRRQYYSALDFMPVPVSEETFRNYGASTTPTLVLIDRAGIVRMYHPGHMSYEELAPRVARIVGRATSSVGQALSPAQPG